MGELTREGIVAALEAERDTLTALVGGISDEQWGRARADGWTIHDIVAHIGDAAFGLGRLALLQSQQPPSGPQPSREEIVAGINRRNDERREKLAAMGRADVEGRIATGFNEAIKAAGKVGDLDTPAVGPAPTVGGLLMRAARHSGEHRAQIEAILR
jgi:uncharacterized protein (TIGR03083 family)